MVRVQAVPVLDKNKAQMLFWKDVGNGILLDHPLLFKLHQSYRYRVIFRKLNPAAKSGYQL